ncbi:hypothetical protein NK718_13055 [Alsobacter sp. SYSU M60028]|uniref:Uncharacterized protein n=1 Tax=Alsobacter ponti TaxID=2962936 RepID=A0ABT1LD63_9HYPH|nr:hypothetical protein [Alsobacter ponti]MCP8939447.1 hypothetical protein [Alsobacter ponti]
MTLPAAVHIDAPAARFPESSPVAWAAEHLRRALAARDIASAPNAATVVTLALGSDAPARAAASAAGVALPDAAEAMALLPAGQGVLAWGADERGLVYALTELADRVSHGADPLFGPDLPLVEQPSARVRSIARLFCSEAEDKGWFHDRQFWHEYLSMLATNRFNRFNLTLGMGYNYPYHNNYITDVYFYFPYPFLLEMPGSGVDVKELSPEERDANLETLKFIARETARRGIDFHLALWTQRYDFDDVPKAWHTVRGITDDNLAPYCRDALTRLLLEVPQIKGLTFRVHVEGGIAEGDYAFWEQAFAGVAAAGRPVEIDMHGKGLDLETIAIARASGMPFAASPKYMAEHMGLPYHQSAIREKEYPPPVARSQREQLSEGSRKFLRYSYGDLLPKEKDWKVVFRIWQGTQRVLMWGDPAMAAGYGRYSIFCGAEGVELLEPNSWKGRMGTGIPGQRFHYQQMGLAPKWDWQKHAYQFRVWGRLLYCPDAPRDSWMRHLRAACGDAAEACERALSLASRVLPLVSLAHGPSASNNHYWPEVYSNLPVSPVGTRRPYGADMEGPVRFGNAPTFDPQLFATPREYAEALHAGRPEGRYTPLDVADWLQALADGCDEALIAIRRSDAFATPDVQRVAIDVGILSGMARFFAGKFRASVWVELFLISKASALLDRAEAQLKRAHLAWASAADIARDVYHDDLTFGNQTWLRGSWQKRLQEIEIELVDIQALRNDAPHETVQPDAGTRAAIAAIEARRPTAGGTLRIEAADSFEAGTAFSVRAVGGGTGATLHYRHVNQAERWKSLPMRRDGDAWAAEIDADYTRSPWHLQFYVAATGPEGTSISPGLAADLSNQPYRVALQA